MKQKKDSQVTHNDEYVKYRYNGAYHNLYEVMFISYRNISDVITMSGLDHRLTRYFCDYSLAAKYAFAVLSRRNRFWTAIITSYNSEKSVNIFRK